MNAVIYTRFSPRKNAATCESCETQERQCREYARQKGLGVSGVYADPDVSGADEFRPTLWQAITALKKGDTLLVYRRDRLARNVYLAESINRAVAKKGGIITAVQGDIEGDGPEQTLVRQIVAAMAEYERKLIAKRVKFAMLTHQKAGKRMSAIPPYGWTTDPDDPSRLILDDAEQKGLATIKALRSKQMGYTAIATELNRLGVPTKSKKGKWYAETVRHILARR